MQSMEPTLGDTVCDGAPTQPGLGQLRPRDQPALSAGDPRYGPIAARMPG